MSYSTASNSAVSAMQKQTLPAITAKPLSPATYFGSGKSARIQSVSAIVNHTAVPTHCPFVIFYILCFACLSVNGAPAVVQTGYGECFPATSCVVDFGVPGTSEINVTAGNLLVMTHRSDNDTANAVTSVTSQPGSRTWLKATNKISVTDFVLDVYYLTNAPGGNTAVTINVGGPPNQMRVCLTEISGCALVNPIHAMVANTATTSEPNAGNITTTVDGCFIFVAVGADGNADAETWVAGSGYTVHNYGGQSITGSDKTMTESRVATTAGVYGATMSNVNDNYSAIAVAFLPAGAEGGGSGVAYRNKGKSVAKGFGPVF